MTDMTDTFLLLDGASVGILPRLSPAEVQLQNYVADLYARLDREHGLQKFAAAWCWVGRGATGPDHLAASYAHLDPDADIDALPDGEWQALLIVREVRAAEAALADLTEAREMLRALRREIAALGSGAAA